VLKSNVLLATAMQNDRLERILDMCNSGMCGGDSVGHTNKNSCTAARLQQYLLIFIFTERTEIFSSDYLVLILQNTVIKHVIVC